MSRCCLPESISVTYWYVTFHVFFSKFHFLLMLLNCAFYSHRKYGIWTEKIPVRNSGTEWCQMYEHLVQALVIRRLRRLLSHVDEQPSTSTCQNTLEERPSTPDNRKSKNRRTISWIQTSTVEA